MDIVKMAESMAEMDNLNHKDGQFQITFTLPLHNTEKLPKFHLLYVSKSNDCRKEIVTEEVSSEAVKAILNIVVLIKQLESNGNEPVDKEMVEQLLKECSKG